MVSRKDEFREILAHAKTLGLRPIPLFQTLGHGEYVLMKGGHGDWMEDPAFPACYCVSKPEVRQFMKDMIHEYLELFGDDVRDFHLGCDEAKAFGTCPKCRAKGRRFDLFLEHFDAMTAELRERGEYAGVIGTTDNQMPRTHVKICELAAQGRFVEARQYQEQVCRFVEVLFTDSNFSTHKSVMKYLGLDCGNARRPGGRPLTEAEYDAYIAKVEALGIFRKDDANLI